MPWFLALTALAVVSAPTADDTLTTRWTSEVTPLNAHREYPRPQLVRSEWINLNGLWDFAVSPESAGMPSQFGRKILVPFPMESKLSGIQESLPEANRAWYRRSFARPTRSKRLLLHFGASDWDTKVWVNGKLVGWHQGGYDPFTFDITKDLSPTGNQEVVVGVADPTDSGPQPRGKQVRKPGGIFYTPASGIWQTVWLEPVPESYIEALRVTTKINPSEAAIRPIVADRAVGQKVRVQAMDGSRVVAEATAPAGETIRLKLPHAKLWSPDSPFLYDLKATLEDSKSKPIDTVGSYFGVREVDVAKDSSGQPKFRLNGKPLFLMGPLDQGYWPDGIYTAPTDQALRYDIDVTKRLGFNMIRKHVKVEPQRWYWWADKLGMVVLQDMPSGDRSIGPNDPDIVRTPESRRIYETELRALIDNLRDHPSVSMWIPFNEGWGQFDTAGITKLIHAADPTRPVDSATGWSDRGTGEFADVHVYPGPGAPKPETGRGSLLGEFGGLGLVTPGHMWKASGWGYQTFQTPGALTDGLVNVLRNLRIIKDSTGLSGAVYTQTTDVETELNGLMTYDRAILKPDAARVRQAVLALYKPSPVIEQIVPASDSVSVDWRYTTEQPASGWTGLRFDDSSWKLGKGGFGTPDTPGAVVGTLWNGSDIWLRRDIEIPHGFRPENLYLRLHHDDEADLYLDGQPIYHAGGWTSSYVLEPLSAQAASLFTPGKHVLAIHCHQDRGGQFIDAGVVRIVERRQ